MAYVFANPNPDKLLVGDCVIRAIALITDTAWEDVYIALVVQGYSMHDMPSSNNVWSTYLTEHNFLRYVIPNTCPSCYTISKFAQDNPTGKYLLATGSHVVACIDGNYLDTWDSGDEIPIYYYELED